MNKAKQSLVGLALVSFVVLVGVAPAQATEVVCVPQAAYTEVVSEAVPGTEAVYETVVVSEAGWQRYSYNGDWELETAPEFPGEAWQANVQGDPHKVGVAGAYFRSNGNSGNGDWFYLEAIAEVTEEQLVTPAVDAIDAVVVEHPEVICPVVLDDIPTSDKTLASTGIEAFVALALALGALLLGATLLITRSRLRQI